MNFLTKFFKSLTGAFTFIAGLVGLGLGAYFLLYPVQTEDPNIVKKAEYNECRKVANRLSMSFVDDPKKDEFVVKFSGIQNYKENIYKTSYLLSECKGFEMKKFCLGTKCENENGNPYVGGVLTMKYVPVLNPDSKK
ncbi:hypothetical protein [Neptuniibacter sp. QD37_11]|uniref:hypothetical protein n=1 Tax=Neptuniibacter sp. QD37_11 TaxID=3398209 RepID=UPI0039F5189F